MQNFSLAIDVDCLHKNHLAMLVLMHNCARAKVATTCKSKEQTTEKYKPPEFFLFLHIYKYSQLYVLKSKLPLTT